ncbi:hypothetical protein [Miltoncostaea oceani]|uniref:hypothetical protein n=1 Tax=Miltoncostaea oceani TaxID=2843216 RepID=UPI001C3CCA81|nr:hypothetical protein [Miltoncostaea oceani]
MNALAPHTLAERFEANQTNAPDPALAMLASRMRVIAETRAEISRRRGDARAEAENRRQLAEVVAFEVGLGIAHAQVPATVEALIAGINQRVPALAHWARLDEAGAMEIDPEWALYEHLHEKFGGLDPAAVSERAVPVPDPPRGG